MAKLPVIQSVDLGRQAEPCDRRRWLFELKRGGIRGLAYIEVFYNRNRRHSHLGDVSPEAFEQASL